MPLSRITLVELQQLWPCGHHVAPVGFSSFTAGPDLWVEGTIEFITPMKFPFLRDLSKAS